MSFQLFWLGFLVQLLGIAIVLWCVWHICVVKSIQKKIVKSEKTGDFTKYKKPLAVLGFCLGSLMAVLMHYPMHFVVLGGIGFALLFHELPDEIKKRRNKRFAEYIINLTVLFETGLKTNVPLENVFEICAEQLNDKRLKVLFKQAGAVYMKTRSIESAFAELEKELDIPELGMLKMVLLEVEQMGQSGLVALESFSRLQETRAYELLSRRRDSANTLTTVAIACVLITSMLVYYAPIYRVVMKNIVEFFIGK